MQKEGTILEFLREIRGLKANLEDFSKRAIVRKQKIKDEFTGQTKEINVFDHYEQDDPDEYRIIFYDHVSLTSTEKGLTLKQSIDKLSEYFVLLRNRYKFSPVVIQQQAFAGESLEAFKENKLRPTIANLADSKYPSRDKPNIFVIILHI